MGSCCSKGLTYSHSSVDVISRVFTELAKLSCSSRVEAVQQWYLLPYIIHHGSHCCPSPTVLLPPSPHRSFTHLYYFSCVVSQPVSLSQGANQLQPPKVFSSLFHKEWVWYQHTGSSGGLKAMMVSFHCACLPCLFDKCRCQPVVTGWKKEREWRGHLRGFLPCAVTSS